MAPRILVVDCNEAFATMLREMLAAEGGYEVEVAHSGTGALTLLREADFDLTIVDMDLNPEDMGYQQLVRDVRQARPTMRLVLIPFMGEDLPPDARELNIQGTLSKPFFADDLLPTIQEALTEEVIPSGPGPQVPAPDQQPEAAEEIMQVATDVQGHLTELAREINADVVVLMSMTPDAQGVVAHVSNLDRVEVDRLAELSVDTVRAAQTAARALGQPDVPFEHNMFEGASLRLYLMVLPEDLLLVVVVPMSTPLGTVRHNLRRTVRDLFS
jgi:CheY-like chemotaxis protein/predicted regulator of Ras-like GTPase activity (Roadblock/LC7/MglB family)